MASEAKQSPGAMVVSTLKSEQFQVSIQQALPPGLSKDRFTRAAITAIQKNPSIVEGDKNSLYSALVESAQLGLMCDGKQAALVTFNTKQGNTWVKKVQFMPMVAGIILNLSRVGATVDAQVVHENDKFVLQLGDDPKIEHTPATLGTDRGKMIGAYAIISTKDGVKYREVMDAAQIEAVRKQSRAADSLMWTQFASEGWRKTVLRRCAKRVPIYDEVVAKTIEADDKTFSFEDEVPPVDPNTVVDYQDPPSVAETPVPQNAAKTHRPKALQEALDQRDDYEDLPPPAEDEVF